MSKGVTQHVYSFMPINLIPAHAHLQEWQVICCEDWKKIPVRGEERETKTYSVRQTAVRREREKNMHALRMPDCFENLRNARGIQGVWGCKVLNSKYYRWTAVSIATCLTMLSSLYKFLAVLFLMKNTLPLTMQILKKVSLMEHNFLHVRIRNKQDNTDKEVNHFATIFQVHVVIVIHI